MEITMEIPKCPQCGKEMVFGRQLYPLSRFDIYTCPDECEGKQSAIVMRDEEPTFSST